MLLPSRSAADAATDYPAATDGSEPAGRAVALAATLAQATGARLRILSVRPDLASGEARRIAEAEGDLGAALEAEAAALLDPAEAIARRSGAARIERIAAWGDSAEIILDHARSADLIVVGRRGRGRLAGLLLGSVSQKLVSLAPGPVVVVP